VFSLPRCIPADGVIVVLISTNFHTKDLDAYNLTASCFEDSYTHWVLRTVSRWPELFHILASVAFSTLLQSPALDSSTKHLYEAGLKRTKWKGISLLRERLAQPGAVVDGVALLSMGHLSYVASGSRDLTAMHLYHKQMQEMIRNSGGLGHVQDLGTKTLLEL
jgi:hypothetical protein